MSILIDKLIQWKDTGEITVVTFGIGDFDEKLDEDVFYWVEEKDDILSLMDKNGVEEFYIIE